MFTNEDLNKVSNTDLSDTEEFNPVSGDMTGHWESLENIRLKKDGKYEYWNLREGLTEEFGFTNKPLRLYGFEARVAAVVTKYVAVHLNSGEVKIYNIETGLVDHTLTGFSTTDAVQFHSSGIFLYVFDGSNSKYINLSNSVISNYYEVRSSPITSYASQTSQDVKAIFGVKEGDRALVFPPELSAFTKKELTYEVYFQDEQTDQNGDLINPEPSLVGEYTQTEINNEVWDTGGTGYYFSELTIDPRAIYTYKPGVEVNIYFTRTIPHKVNYNSLDSDGYFSFSTSKKTVAKFRFDSSVTSVTMPELKDIDQGDINSEDNFSIVRYATIGKANGSLVAFIDEGGTIDVNNNYQSVVGIDESVVSLAGESYYDTASTDFFSTEESSNIEGGITSYSYIGRSLFSGSGQGDTTYYRQYVLIDVLDDGSVCIPGKPLTVSREPKSDMVGVQLTVGSPAKNVAKRFLCSSRYKPSEENAYRPSSENNANSPLFIVREIDTSKTSVIDLTDNDSLIRPVLEQIPMAAGIPAIFGAGQIVPQSISAFEETVAIGGYTINRPTPTLYTSFSNNGNLYFDKSGVATSTPVKTVTIFFEYTDGTYSQKITDTLFDISNTLTIHSLNSLISTVHVYVDDGTTEYKVGSYQPTDAEFCGMPIEIPLDFTALNQISIPTGLDVLETVNLSNYVTVPIPAQNVQISSQAKIFGNDSIVGIVPLDYDLDRNPLRYRLLVFTTDNIQTGYITEVQQGTVISYNSKFEISDSSRRAKKRKSINKIGESIFFQDEQGVNVISGGKTTLLIDNEQYPIASNDLTDVAFNEPDNEVWFLFDNTDVLVFDGSSKTIRSFSFSGGLLSTATYQDNKLFVSTGNSLCRAESGGTDLGAAIKGTATTKHLGALRLNTEINEVHIYGNGSDVTLGIDDQPQRERYGSTFDGYDFTSQKSIGPKAIKVKGTIFVPNKIGVKPRIQFQLENQTTAIENIIVKTITTKRAL